jgi:hypothetical protein
MYKEPVRARTFLTSPFPMPFTLSFYKFQTLNPSSHQFNASKYHITFSQYELRPPTPLCYTWVYVVNCQFLSNCFIRVAFLINAIKGSNISFSILIKSNCCQFSRLFNFLKIKPSRDQHSNWELKKRKKEKKVNDLKSHNNIWYSIKNYLNFKVF